MRNRPWNSFPRTRGYIPHSRTWIEEQCRALWADTSEEQKERWLRGYVEERSGKQYIRPVVRPDDVFGPYGRTDEVGILLRFTVLDCRRPIGEGGLAPKKRETTLIASILGLRWAGVLFDPIREEKHIITDTRRAIGDVCEQAKRRLPTQRRPSGSLFYVKALAYYHRLAGKTRAETAKFLFRKSDRSAMKRVDALVDSFLEQYHPESRLGRPRWDHVFEKSHPETPATKGTLRSLLPRTTIKLSDSPQSIEGECRALWTGTSPEQRERWVRSYRKGSSGKRYVRPLFNPDDIFGPYGPTDEGRAEFQFTVLHCTRSIHQGGLAPKIRETTLIASILGLRWALVLFDPLREEDQIVADVRRDIGKLRKRARKRFPAKRSLGEHRFCVKALAYYYRLAGKTREETARRILGKTDARAMKRVDALVASFMAECYRRPRLEPIA
jgi:hypothetical protein